MTTIEALNKIPVSDLLRTLNIKYTKKGGTYNLYEGRTLTGGWKAKEDGVFSDFSEKGRPQGDRLEFIMQYLNISKHEALKWVEEMLGIQNDFKPLTNPIKDKWDAFEGLLPNQITYLKERVIDYSSLKGVIKNYNNNICMPIKGHSGNIKSLQSRSIVEGGSRYYVEANTDSDGVFMDGINPNNKTLIVVEGFTDFLSIRQYTSNVIGLLNAKNDGQLQIIKDFSNNYDIFFIPDNDDAGKVTVEKFNSLGIKHNLFKLDNYGVKDINEFLVNFGIGEDVLDVIYGESERPPSNLQLALNKAREYKVLFDANGGKLGFPSGYEQIDKYTDGIIKGKVYMIMAYSNVGKTRFAYSLLKNIIQQKKKVHFYSLEVDTGMLFIEMVGAIKGWTKEEVLSRLDSIDLSGLDEFVEIHDEVRSLEQIENSIRNEKPDVAIIDFVQNIEEKGSEYEKMTEIALRMQKLAILSGTSIFQLSQVSNESRFADGTNILPKGSGALFASSDVIFTLWGRDGNKYLTISKNKYGKAGVNYLLNIDYATSTFNMTEDELGASSSQFRGL